VPQAAVIEGDMFRPAALAWRSIAQRSSADRYSALLPPASVPRCALSAHLRHGPCLAIAVGDHCKVALWQFERHRPQTALGDGASDARSK